MTGAPKAGAAGVGTGVEAVTAAEAGAAARAGTARQTPEFTLRVSDRARHVRLVITERGELLVVVPRRFDRLAIPGIIEAKRAWIERARARVETRRDGSGPADGSGAALPDRVVLPALGEEWQVEYRPPSAAVGGRRGAVARAAPGGILVVTCADGDHEDGSRALIEWLRRRARGALLRRLAELSARDGLSFTRAGVRHQRTRWGSCSARGTISLNLRLLFLEPEVVDHILTHELCHTRELNHSKRFWALVRAHDPDWILHRQQAREAWRSLPDWIHPQQAGPRP